MRYGYIVYLDGAVISESSMEYDSYSEAESEGNFSASCYADSMDRHWSEFDVEVVS